ncbi:MAG: glycosyltransferase family 39 protein, partial [Microgenomates group bacterium]
MKKIWLILILVIAVFFRFFHLTSSPPGLNWDEVSIGYNAYSILRTGRDEWGQFMPISFKAFGEYKLPGMIYASIPGIALFGTTDLGVRVTPAILGVLAVYLIYLLTKKLFGSEMVALVASALLAISPWAVHFSRVSFEAGLAMVFVLTSIYFLPNLWLSMIFAVLGFYTYNSVRILLPLLFLAYAANSVISFAKPNFAKISKVIIVALILLSPVLIGLLNPAERVRWGTLSITNQKSFTESIAESRGYTLLPGILPRLVQNKATHYAYILFTNYVNIFSTEFLFTKG